MVEHRSPFLIWALLRQYSSECVVRRVGLDSGGSLRVVHLEYRRLQEYLLDSIKSLLMFLIPFETYFPFRNLRKGCSDL